MGFEDAGFRVSGLLSRHNSERDKRDAELWRELHDRVEAIVNDEKYAPIMPMMH